MISRREALKIVASLAVSATMPRPCSIARSENEGQAGVPAVNPPRGEKRGGLTFDDLGDLTNTTLENFPYERFGAHIVWFMSKLDDGSFYHSWHSSYEEHQAIVKALNRSIGVDICSVTNRVGDSK